MATIDNSIKYMNILASAIKIVDSFHGEYTDVYAIHNRDKMEESVCKQMDQLFAKSEDLPSRLHFVNGWTARLYMIEG